MRSETTRSRLIALLLLTLTASYLAGFISEGWIPHDDGLLAATAERVLSGQLPHTDYVDLYTGGLSYLHAATFALLGISLSSLRLMLFAGSMLFLYGFYRAASRFVSPVPAACMTALAAAWSLPNYFAALPSWYTLFFTTFGLLALLSSLEAETSKRSRAAVAGFFAGASLTFKVTGLYFILAAVLLLLYDAQRRRRLVEAPTRGRPHVLTDWVVGSMPLVALGCLLSLVSYRLDFMNVVHFVLPGLALSCIPLAERLSQGVKARLSLAELKDALAPFLAGLGVPLALLVGWTAHRGGAGALLELYEGVFVTPRLRLTFAEKPLPPWGSLLLGLPFVALFVPKVQSILSQGRRWLLLVIVFAGTVAAGGHAMVYQGVWASVRPLVPALVLLVLWQLRSDAPDGATEVPKTRLYLMATTAAFFSLVQIPYSTATYFFYAAPLVVLLALSLLADHREGRPVQVCLAAFYLLFAILWLNGADVRAFGVRYQPRPQLVPFPAERALIDVPQVHRDGYGRLLTLIGDHATDDEFIWAGPDAPEIYFLAGKSNPTRTYFDFFQGENEVGASDHTAFLSRLEETGVRLVVINTRPEFSRPLDPALLARLGEVYPQAVQVGPMWVRWQAPAPGSRSAGS